MQIITNCDNTISRMMEWGWRLSITWLWKEDETESTVQGTGEINRKCKGLEVEKTLKSSRNSRRWRGKAHCG